MVIVVISWIETFFNTKGMSALRTFRLARVLKLIKKWKSMRLIVESLLEALPSVMYAGVLMCLYMFIMAVAGMQLYGTKLPTDSRHNFTNFGFALLTVFQMLSGENWNAVGGVWSGPKCQQRHWIHADGEKMRPPKSRSAQNYEPRGIIHI